MKKYYEDMDIARGIGIFLVILGHAFPDGKFNNNTLYTYIYKFIYSFHMPLFFIISGFFAYKVYKISNVQEYKKFVFIKFKRLMIPYFAVTLIAVPIKLYMNKYAARPININDLIKNMVFYPTHTPIEYFWFIYTLFLMFAIAPLLNKIPIKLTLLITFVLNLLPISQSGIFYLYGPLHFIFYFYLGIYLFTIYDKYKEFKNKKMLSVMVLVILLVLNLFTVSKAVFPYHNLVTALTGSILFINIAWLVMGRKVGNVFKYIGQYSYDIYLFSWFFQTGARVILFQMLKLDYTLVTLIMIFVGFLPIVLSNLILKKIPVLDKVLLGNTRR